MVKNQIIMAGGPNKNMTASQLKQALNMVSFNFLKDT